MTPKNDVLKTKAQTKCKKELLYEKIGKLNTFLSLKVAFFLPKVEKVLFLGKLLEKGRKRRILEKKKHLKIN